VKLNGESSSPIYDIEDEDNGGLARSKPDQTYNFNNVTEEYGTDNEGLPSDEDDMDEQEGSVKRKNRDDDDDDKASRNKYFGIGCCIIIVIILAIVLGVVLGGKDKEKAPAPKKLPPSESPSEAPSVEPPISSSPSVSPSFALREETIIEAHADTYLFIGADEDNMGPFGKESSMLVQNGGTELPSIGVIQFEKTVIPEYNRIRDYPVTANIVMEVVNPDSLPPNVTVDTMKFLSTEMKIESLTSFQDQASFDRLLTVPGPSFSITPDSRFVTVDITELLYDPALSVGGRRLDSPESEFLIGLMVRVDETGDLISVRFASAEGEFPPKLELLIDLPSIDNSAVITAAPSISASPTITPAPSESDLSKPGEWSYICHLCGEGNNITNPKAPLDMPVIGKTTCEELQDVGYWGGILESNCELILDYVEICCEDVFVCPICGENEDIINPNGKLDDKVADSGTCADAAEQASNGLILEVDCVAVQEISSKVCCGVEL